MPRRGRRRRPCQPSRPRSVAPRAAARASSLPSGSNATRTRAVSLAFGSGVPNPSSPARPPRAAAIRRRAGRGRARAAERRFVVGGHVHRADADLGEPAHPGRVERRAPAPAAPTGAPRSGRGARRRASAARRRGVASRRSRRARPRRRPPPLRAARACACRPTRCTTVGTGARRTSNGSASVDEPLATSSATRLAPQRDLHDAHRWCRTTRRAGAGRSKPLTFFTVGPPPFTSRPSAVTKRTSSTRSRSGP